MKKGESSGERRKAGIVRQESAKPLSERREAYANNRFRNAPVWDVATDKNH